MSKNGTKVVKKGLFVLLLGVTVLFSACSTSITPPLEETIEVGLGETLYIDPQTGEMFTESDLEVQPQGFSITLCSFRWNNIHQTSRGGVKEVKGDWTGSCPSSSDPFYLTPRPTLLRESSFGSYLPVSHRNVVATRKYVSTSGANWIRTEIFSTTACINTRYKSRLDFTANNPQGVSIPLNSAISSAYMITTC